MCKSSLIFFELLWTPEPLHLFPATFLRCTSVWMWKKSLKSIGSGGKEMQRAVFKMLSLWISANLSTLLQSVCEHLHVLLRVQSANASFHSHDLQELFLILRRSYHQVDHVYFKQILSTTSISFLGPDSAEHSRFYTLLQVWSTIWPKARRPNIQDRAPSIASRMIPSRSWGGRGMGATTWFVHVNLLLGNLNNDRIPLCDSENYVYTVYTVERW